MRGGDDQTGELFSYVDLEARVRQDHPIPEIVSAALTILEPEFAALYHRLGPVAPAGEAFAGDAAAGVLFDPVGAASGGAGGVRSCVPLMDCPDKSGELLTD